MNQRQGGCRCGAVRYEVSGDPENVTLCHCSDCRKSAGAPMVAWAAFREERFRLMQGEPASHNSSVQVMRGFCRDCGTGLTYRHAEMLPGIVDIQSVTLDDPEALPPQAHIQTAERLGWMASAHQLRGFERYPDA